MSNFNRDERDRILEGSKFYGEFERNKPLEKYSPPGEGWLLVAIPAKHISAILKPEDYLLEQNQELKRKLELKMGNEYEVCWARNSQGEVIGVLRNQSRGWQEVQDGSAMLFARPKVAAQEVEPEEN